MKLNNISLPYPVLGVNDDITPALSENAVEIERDDSNKLNYTINVRLNFDNPTIVQLIKDGFASYVCEVDCVKTNLRRSVTSQDAEFQFDISRNHVAGNVLLSCYVTVIKPILHYTNPGFHSDYKGYSFNMAPGDILVGFPERSFNADVKYDLLQSASSYMQIREEKYNKITNFDYSGNTIDIKLPSELFKIYTSGIGHSFAEIIHSSLAFNALVNALWEINNYRSSVWADAIMHRLRTETEFEEFVIVDDDGIETITNIAEVATRLLKDPYDRMLRKLKDIKNINDNTSMSDE